MEKSWGKSPWIIRLIFLYWLIPALIIIGLYLFFLISISGTNVSGLWIFPFEILKAEYELMPISTSFDIALTLMVLLGAYYSWRFLKGSGMARSILEFFSWVLVITTLINIVYPKLQYLELDNLPPGHLNMPLFWLFMNVLLLLIECLVLFGLRTKTVKEYANIF